MPSAAELAHQLRALRAPPAARGGRRALLGMLRAYEQWRGADGKVPATYEVIFGVLEKR